MTYYTDPNADSGFINQNLVHLLKTTQTYASSTPTIKRTYFSTYTPQGKPYDPFVVAPAFLKQLRDAIAETA